MAERIPNKIILPLSSLWNQNLHRQHNVHPNLPAVIFTLKIGQCHQNCLELNGDCSLQKLLKGSHSHWPRKFGPLRIPPHVSNGWLPVTAGVMLIITRTVFFMASKMADYEQMSIST